MSERKITKRTVEYRVNAIDEFGDIIDTDGYVTLAEAMSHYKRCESTEIEKVTQRWEAYEDNVRSSERTHGKAKKGELTPDAGWECVDTSYEMIVSA